MDKSNTLNRILSLKIGETSSDLTFAQRLARENAWTDEFSDRVITEYKKFIYLAFQANEQVTPSDAVDQAWHLHLTYTDSYWNDLCRNILGVELHHNPTVGGLEQRNKFRTQYINTLNLYQRIFRECPPKDIWPGVEERFKDAEAFIRVNRNKNWLVPKLNKFSTYIGASIGVASLLAACSNIQEKEGWFWFALILAVLAFVVVASRVLWKLLGRPNKSKGDGGCGAACGGCGGCGG